MEEIKFVVKNDLNESVQECETLGDAIYYATLHTGKENMQKPVIEVVYPAPAPEPVKSKSKAPPPGDA